MNALRGPEEIDFGGPDATALDEGWEEESIIQLSCGAESAILHAQT